MSRCVVNVATGSLYVRGQARLIEALALQGVDYVHFRDRLPEGSPTHFDIPYAFKAFALKEAAETFDTLLWCDACIVPGPRPLDELWEKIERDGVWIAKNGYSNYEWTADGAYPALFSLASDADNYEEGLAIARERNRKVQHVVATAFGISPAHPKGRELLDEYFRLASETKAFCGPWQNRNWNGSPARPADPWRGERIATCGPPDVRGHRHDQTALSVIAWRIGVELNECPEWFSYRGGETERTCLVADGAY